MSGYPTRTSRAQMGPDLTNTGEITNPNQQADAAHYNLLRFVAAGSGLMVPVAWVEVDADGGGDEEITGHAEAWNPDGITVSPYTPPELARASTGTYSLTYATSYPDADGNDIPTVFKGGWGFVTEENPSYKPTDVEVWRVAATPYILQIRVYGNNAGTPALADYDFVVCAWM